MVAFRAIASSEEPPAYVLNSLPALQLWSVKIFFLPPMNYLSTFASCMDCIEVAQHKIKTWLAFGVGDGKEGTPDGGGNEVRVALEEERLIGCMEIMKIKMDCG